LQFYVTIPEVQGQKWAIPKVQIMDPRGEQIFPQINPIADDPTRFEVRYTPKDVGNHQISVKHEGEPIPGSPFTSKAYDSNCVKLSMIDKAVVGRLCHFAIDAAKAGAGNMEIIVSVGTRNVPNYVAV
jgi:filamin